MLVFRKEKCTSFFVQQIDALLSKAVFTLAVMVVIAVIVVIMSMLVIATIVALRAMGRVSVESALIVGSSCLSSVVYLVIFKYCLSSIVCELFFNG